MKWFKRKRKSDTEPHTEPGEETVVLPEGDLTETESIPAKDHRTQAPEAPVADHAEADERDDTDASPVLGESVDEPEDSHRKRNRLFKRLRERLHKTRENLVSRMDRLFLGKKTIDLELMEDLEEVLITSDLGVRTAQSLIRNATEKIRRKELNSPQKLRELMQEEIRGILSSTTPATPLNFPAEERPFVVMVVGVNGVGKTTTIGKLAHQLKHQGHKVMLVAADTFRAAAIEQLVIWGERAGVPVIQQKSGSDPSAVAFDGMDAAISRNVDVVIVDTAGRMHTKVNLMEELKKVQRVISKKMPSAPHEVLLVLDATTGQNALSQARMFKDGIGVTGLILTKLDGTAKGGIIVAVSEEIKVPVRFIGIGEGLDDLRPFDPEEFTHALF